MLQSLYIRNYALINEAKIEFANGFVTITGETGAGKSILLGALGLVTGNRADTSVLRDESGKCVVEALFNIKKLDLSAFFELHELDYENNCILRREIASNGRSRSFINDTPVQLNVLKELASNLVDIHSQHQTILLKDEKFQVEVLDLFANNEKPVKTFNEQKAIYREIEKTLNELKQKESKIKAEHEFVAYQLEELENADIDDEGEQDDLEAGLNKGENAEEIKTALDNSIQLLSESENNIIDYLYKIKTDLGKLTQFDKDIEQIENRVNQVYEELRDISLALSSAMDNTDFDPDKKREIEERLDLLYTLQKKHGVQSIASLIQLKEEFLQKLEAGASFDTTIQELSEKLKIADSQLETTADKISRNRTSKKDLLEKRVLELLKKLGMVEASFIIEITPLHVIGVYGKDKIRFLFSANKGMKPIEINKSASGGELSRLMLALKSLVSERKNQPTIIFDEIDTGVSGNIADKLGDEMRNMSKNQQVIAITHLPQIAGKGDQHFKVEKSEAKQETISSLRLLNENERIEELASMLSGAEITEEAVNNARVLLGK